MEDELTTASLQVLEDLTHNRSFGQAGLHSVSERPSMRDRTSTGPKTTFRRSSLMNERTRLRRASRRTDNERSATARSRLPMRKRKSDELSSIDLSELDDSSSFYKTREPEVLSPLTPPKNALENIGDVFSGINARWQHAFQSEMCLPPRPEMETDKSFHPLSGSGIFTKPRAPPEKKGGANVTPGNPFATKSVPTPLSPAFRHFRDPSSSSNEGDSPCSVAAITRGCGACFWERSLAWSEDDDSDDDGVVHSRTIRRTGSITEHLSVPKHLGKEFAETTTTAPLSNSRPLRRPSMSRTITLESDSRHKLPGAKMFRQTDVDKVTAIHWEEKVVDTTAIDLMAKLSL